MIRNHDVQELGLDEYEQGSTHPTLQRAPLASLTADEGKMALAGWHSVAFEAEGIAPFRAEPSLPFLNYLLTRTLGCCMGATDEAEGDVECRLVGLPELLAAPGSDYDLFAALVNTENYKVVGSDVMRAAIDFKWQAFGERKWAWQVARFAVIQSRYRRDIAKCTQSEC